MRALMRWFLTLFEMKMMEAMKVDKSLRTMMSIRKRRRSKLYTLISTGMRRASNGERKVRARLQHILRRDKKNN